MLIRSMRHLRKASSWDGRNQKTLISIIVFSLIAILTASLNSQITDSPIASDGAQNLKAAYNLAYYGVISASGSPESDLSPTDYREPLPIVFLAAHLRLHPALSSGLTADTINEGLAVIAVKQHNLIWASLCLLGVALTILLSIRSPTLGTVAAVIAMALTYQLFLGDKYVIDSTYTEVQAGALLGLVICYLD
jgi:hypothetical protein